MALLLEFVMENSGKYLGVFSFCLVENTEIVCFAYLYETCDLISGKDKGKIERNKLFLNNKSGKRT